VNDGRASMSPCVNAVRHNNQILRGGSQRTAAARVCDLWGSDGCRLCETLRRHERTGRLGLPHCTVGGGSISTLDPAAGELACGDLISTVSMTVAGCRLGGDLDGAVPLASTISCLSWSA
jgi:hypothetical protein